MVVHTFSDLARSYEALRTTYFKMMDPSPAYVVILLVLSVGLTLAAETCAQVMPMHRSSGIGIPIFDRRFLSPPQDRPQLLCHAEPGEAVGNNLQRSAWFHQERLLS